MNLQEFAGNLVEALKENPSNEQLEITVNRIKSAKFDGMPASPTQIEELLDCMEVKMENFTPVFGTIDVHEIPNYMEMIRKKLVEY